VQTAIGLKDMKRENGGINTKDCPSCRNQIEDWQAVCKNCWNILQRHDKKFGSNFCTMVTEELLKSGKRESINKELLAVLQDRLTPDASRKSEKLKQKMKKVCNACYDQIGSKDIDECFKCPYYILFNKMLEEIWNGK
jgi:hypothetical protein